MALLAATAGAGAFLAAMATPGSARPEGGATRSIPYKLVGNSSCAARGCHGAVGPIKPEQGDVYIKGGSSTTWRYFDPHANAYEVLKSERSKTIAKNLGATIGNKAAHESKTCLVCHATVDPTADSFAGFDLAEGVSCEACHGPAGDWRESHLSTTWLDAFRKASPVDRAKLTRMNDLSDAEGRAKTCVGCHVGDRSEGLDVNHDLIAAGHPRLNFEYSAYLASYPKHWDEKARAARAASKKDFDEAAASDWAIGQAVTTRAALRLLADRARSSVLEKADGAASVAPWPEFSEIECFACHHTLAKPAWNPDRGGSAVRPGGLPWATWTSSMLPDLAKIKRGWKFDPAEPPWSDLRAQMTRGVPDARKVAELADSAAGRIDEWLKAPEGSPPNPAELVQWIEQWTNGSDRPATWDQSAQRTLAASALARSARAMGIESSPLKKIDEALRAAREKLSFPRGFDSPRGGRPGAGAAP